MPITENYVEGLTKQVFLYEVLLNGLFPCQSDVVRLIRSKKRAWDSNDKFEYRMLLSNTNSGGSLNSQVYTPNANLIRPGKLDYGIFKATYGTVTDGLTIDMTASLETEEKRASFEHDYAVKFHSLRTNVASLFKNFAIHGKFGVVHQIRDCIKAPTLPAEYNPQPNCFTPVVGQPFTIKVPINVFQTNFKKGKYLIKTTATGTNIQGPDDPADVAELYLVLDNQPGLLCLLPCGTKVSEWSDGQFLEVAHNREVVGMPQDIFTRWDPGKIVVATNTIWKDQVFDQFIGTGTYTSGDNAVVGAMEGLADLFPWYTNPASPEKRLGLNRGFRDQPNRLFYSTEQAGGFVLQREGEHIIDAIMRGALLTKATVPYAEVGVWMNPITRTQMGYEESDNVRILRDNFVQGPIVYQRGVKTTDYQIGNQVVKEVVEDLNMPTDVIIIGPKNDLSYNCWDSSIAQIDDFIQETFSKSAPPSIDDLSVPDEFLTKLDIKNRVTFGNPVLSDGNLASFGYGNGIRHPKNIMPMALHEMGAIFTEYPYTYTVVKLREPIADLTTV